MIYHGWQTLHYLDDFFVILDPKSNHLVRKFEVFFHDTLFRTGDYN